jgi:hypothetical protein
MLMTNEWQAEVLTTYDREQWRSLIEGMPRRDAFFVPEYSIPFERVMGGKVQLFFFGDSANYVAYPFFLRRINDLTFFQSSPLDHGQDYFDIVSPYGYSGPLACVSEPNCQRDLWRGYLDTFHEYCQEAHIVCEFARLNPFLENEHYLLEMTNGVRATGQITYVDLTLSWEDVWRGLNRGNRSNINKARRSGIQVERCDDSSHRQQFHDLYVATMRRNEADDWYYFPPDFFADSFRLLDGEISLFHASYQGKIIAAASFLHYGDTVHYFLGGSDGNYLALRPNNLLMYEAICWAKKKGYRFFNLGGGYKQDDSLTRFKAAFSKSSVPFYTYRTIHCPDVYQELCRQYTAYRLKVGREVEDTDYFPKYRASGS